MLLAPGRGSDADIFDRALVQVKAGRHQGDDLCNGEAMTNKEAADFWRPLFHDMAEAQAFAEKGLKLDGAPLTRLRVISDACSKNLAKYTSRGLNDEDQAEQFPSVVEFFS